MSGLDIWLYGDVIGHATSSRTLSLSVDRTFQLEAITVARLVSEATTWGINASAAETTIRTTLTHLAEAILRKDLRCDLDVAEPIFASLRSRALALQSRF